ncbi:serine/threonine protein kinase [Phormidesmis priestleyi ULC007]|uniref:non-specific serine/threonine protein kinase n=1 Tax=Phormidesmis priestleyi ULC007 TaxID=1920490 RepID=A0A2T1DEC8_9CYAN|nr:serine/threonine-protein kinase [Phormidesmis priestleyi]PSB18838.1 serine/threonine protein kinase [Phormidesmis priestleyi ULC007]PZO51023.1 MAG: serine/threonine protein kinase [Phormidesmis priestleyi]
MQLYCTRPGCSKPTNFFTDLDNLTTLKTIKQKFCTNCGMSLILADRYLPTKLLGQGGFGAAFLARDRYTPGLRQCVVKQFQPSGRLTPDQLQMAQDLFEREAEALEQLGRQHSQIPDLFAFFELSIPSPHQATEDKFFYLVQEFIDGETLEERLIRQGKFSESEVLEVLKEALKILQFVHENGSIHRDIKPSNIMWNLNRRLYLLDFGAVKYATKAAGGSKVSTSIYSLGFAPPEQVSGDEVYPSTDLYALAVTCIMLLTGKQPPELFNAYNNSWKWQSYVQTSQLLADVLDKMLLPVPDQRFQSATDVLEALVVRSPLPQPSSQPLPSSNTSPPPPVSVSGSQPIRQRASVQPFSILELLGNAAFTGCEGALLAIALFSLPIPSPISAGLWLVIALGLVVAQSRRIIEKVDLVILAGITFVVIGFLPVLHAVVVGLSLGNGFLAVAILAGFGALSAIAITALFRLIYKLLTNLL